MTSRGLICACLAAGAAVFALTTVPTTAQQPLTVVLQAPRNPGAGKPPLLVLLHGYGADENDLLPFVVNLDPRLAVASLRAPIRIDEERYSWLNGNSDAGLAQARRTVLENIDRVVTAANADASRVYVAGFSQGAMLALDIALTEPQKIAGAAVISGRLPSGIRDRHAPLNLLRGFPVIVTHGKQDRQISIDSARDIRQTLAPWSLTLEYHEFDGAHYISDEMVRALDQWLRRQLARRSG